MHLASPHGTSRLVAVLNPNTSASTTEAMTAIVARELHGSGLRVRGYTALEGPAMIVDLPALEAAASQVVASAKHAVEDNGPDLAAVIIGAFGDPGLQEVRATTASVTVVGLAEAALLAAARDGRRFGIATTTPNLRPAMEATVARLGLAEAFTGFRFTAEDPVELVRDPARLVDALGRAAADCADRDGAECVVIGGGPLSRAGEVLATRGGVPVIVPIVEAARAVIHRTTADGVRPHR